MTWGRELETLSSDECWKLVETHPGQIGRIALGGPRPDILPINYCTDGKSIVFKTAAGKKLDAALNEAYVAFEVDWVQSDWEIGWSVLFRGQARRVVDPDEIARLRSLPLSPWAEGEKENFVRIQPEIVSGRRLT